MRHSVFPAMLLTSVMLWATPAVGQTAREIVDATLERNAMGFQSGKAQLTLTIEDAQKERRVRSLEVKSKKIGGLTRTLVTLTAPKEVLGQAFLFAEQPGEDDVWMYLPAFKVTRRIEGGQKGGAFLGSHFTYADLESRDLREGNVKKLPDETIGKDAVFVLEATPKGDAKSDYSAVVTYVRKSDYIPLKVKFYERGKLAKTLFVEQLDKTAAGETYAKQMTLRPVGGGYTTLTIDALATEAAIPDATFSKEQLGK